MKPMEYIDRQAVNAAWYAKYLEQIAKTGNERIAMREADTLIRRTQPVGTIIDLPSMQKKNEIVRAFTMFTNQVNQNLNMAFEDFILGDNRKRNIVRNIAYNWIIASMVMYMIENLGSAPWDEPEEIFTLGITNNITDSIPLINTLTKSLLQATGNVAKVARGEKIDASTFKLSFTPTALQGAEKLVKGMASWNVPMAMTGAGTIAGVPTVSLGRMKTAIGTMYDKGIENWYYLIFSKWSIENNAKKK